MRETQAFCSLGVVSNGDRVIAEFGLGVNDAVFQPSHSSLYPPGADVRLVLGFMLEAVVGDPLPERLVIEPAVVLGIVESLLRQILDPALSLGAHAVKIFQDETQRAGAGFLVPAVIQFVY